MIPEHIKIYQSKLSGYRLSMFLNLVKANSTMQCLPAISTPDIVHRRTGRIAFEG